MKFKSERYEGDVIEKYHGVAWSEPWRFVDVTYVMPFNFIVRWIRKVYFFFVWRNADKDMDIYNYAYKKGFEAGKKIVK